MQHRLNWQQNKRCRYFSFNQLNLMTYKYVNIGTSSYTYNSPHIPETKVNRKKQKSRFTIVMMATVGRYRSIFVPEVRQHVRCEREQPSAGDGLLAGTKEAQATRH
jgi:hypothetical protein